MVFRFFSMIYKRRNPRARAVNRRSRPGSKPLSRRSLCRRMRNPARRRTPNPAAAPGPPWSST